MSKWPFPGDLPVDRARQVAIQYRDALWHADREACAAIDTAAVLAGENWVINEWAIEQGEDLVTVARAAVLVGRSKRWVYSWAATHDAVLTRRGPMLVRLDDVRAAVASERRKRAHR